MLSSQSYSECKENSRVRIPGVSVELSHLFDLHMHTQQSMQQFLVYLMSC